MPVTHGIVFLRSLKVSSIWTLWRIGSLLSWVVSTIVPNPIRRTLRCVVSWVERRVTLTTCLILEICFISMATLLYGSPTNGMLLPRNILKLNISQYRSKDGLGLYYFINKFVYMSTSPCICTWTTKRLCLWPTTSWATKGRTSDTTWYETTTWASLNWVASTQNAIGQTSWPKHWTR